MKRYKRVWILLGVLVVVVAAALVATRVRERKEDIKTSGETFLAIAPDDVTKLSFTSGDTSLAFHRDDTWLWNDDEAFPVDQEKIADLLAPFENLSAAFVIDGVTDYGQYGLTEPECTVELTMGENTTTVKMGAYSTLDQQRYVDIGDGKVYLVADDPRETFDVELSDLIKNDTVPVFESLASARITAESSWSFTYDEEGDSYSDKDVYFSDSGLPLDTSRVDDWLDKLTAASLDEYVTYNATEEELASCGLDAPMLSVELTAADGESVKLELSEIEPAEGEEGETKAYLRVNGSQIVYAITPDDYTFIARCAYDDLRHLELFTPTFDTVTAIDVTLEGEKYTFARGENEDGESVWTYNDGEVDISSLEAAVEALSALEFTGESPADKQEIALTLHLADEAHPELSLSLYRLDGAKCLAQVNGETVCTLTRSTVITLVEAVNTLILG